MNEMTDPAPTIEALRDDEPADLNNTALLQSLLFTAFTSAHQRVNSEEWEASHRRIGRMLVEAERRMDPGERDD